MNVNRGIEYIRKKHDISERKAERLVAETDERRSSYQNFIQVRIGDIQKTMTFVWMLQSLELMGLLQW